MSGAEGGPNPPPPAAKIEPNSPFYLGPQDRPGDFITPTKLRGDNYEDWAGDIQTALEARRKFDFLNGTITAPVPPCTQSDWHTINAMLISWIMNTINPEVKCYLSKYRDAKKLWDTLKSRFAVVNGPRIQQLKYSIAMCEQTKTMPVSEYFGKLTALWEELHRHEPIIDCSCCDACTAGSKHENRRDTDMLHKFLMGLHSDYFSTLRSSILSQDPLPSLDKAFQLVVQDERVRTAQASFEDKPPEVLGFSVRANLNKGRGRGGDRPDKSHLSCSHCKKTGHESSNCFELVGYPEWWEDRSKNDGGGRGGRSGGRGRGNARANSLSMHSTVAGHNGGSNTNASPLLFTAEQWKALTGLMSTSKIPDEHLNGKFQKRLWIIDSGVTHHVTGDATWLTNTRKIPGCLVGLPNNKKVVATHEGSVQLSDKITLKRVLLVPQLNCNLILVSQLNDDMKCVAHFDSYMCAIQDRSRRLIGTGVRRDGLYYFGKGDSILHVSANGATSTLELWHKRMGHPSEKVVKSLPPVSNCHTPKPGFRRKRLGAGDVI
ncbi:hypothetical protein LXL04_033506 [Taraxacum kok-saghyz]